MCLFSVLFLMFAAGNKCCLPAPVIPIIVTLTDLQNSNNHNIEKLFGSVFLFRNFTLATFFFFSDCAGDCSSSSSMMHIKSLMRFLVWKFILLSTGIDDLFYFENWSLNVLCWWPLDLKSTPRGCELFCWCNNQKKMRPMGVEKTGSLPSKH